jgi:hypothetical protein
MRQTRTLFFAVLHSLAAFPLQIHRLEAKSLWAGFESRLETGSQAIALVSWRAPDRVRASELLRHGRSGGATLMSLSADRS